MNSKELEPQAEAALRFLNNEAERHGQDRANADYMDAWVKAERARIMALFVGLSNAAAEAEAMRHPDYLNALQAKKEADTLWYTAQFKREAAGAVIEAWRTVCSNERRLP